MGKKILVEREFKNKIIFSEKIYHIFLNSLKFYEEPFKSDMTERKEV